MFDPYGNRAPDLTSDMASGGPFSPGNQAPEGGPLANLQGDIARGLTGDGRGNFVYIPGGPGGPVIQVPNPARWGYPNQQPYPQRAVRRSSGSPAELTPADVEWATRLLAYAILLAVGVAVGWAASGGGIVVTIASGVVPITALAVVRRIRRSHRTS
jgi:hypothetical protein